MKPSLAILGLLCAALLVSSCKCPPGIAENHDNVAAIVAENETALAASTEAESVKAARALRNKEALELARKLRDECQ